MRVRLDIEGLTPCESLTSHREDKGASSRYPDRKSCLKLLAFGASSIQGQVTKRLLNSFDGGQWSRGCGKIGDCEFTKSADDMVHCRVRSVI